MGTKEHIRKAFVVFVVLLSAVIFAEQKDPCSVAILGGYEYFLEDIMENVEVGSELGVLTLEGNSSEVTLTPTGHDFLRLNETTWSIILKQPLSVDKGAPEIPLWIINCIAAVDNARMIDITVRVIVEDYNNNAPVFNSIYHNTTVPENADVGSVVYSGAAATDNDKPFDRNSQVIYSIVAGRFSNYFVLTAATSPVITLAKELDYEKETQMIIELKAMDRPKDTQPQRSSTATIIVNIEDKDDLNPEFTSKTYYGSLPEDAPAGTYVTLQKKVVAEDQDSMKEPIRYRLLDPYDMFDIHPETAEIRFFGPMYEGMRTVTVVVLASQVNNPMREGFAILTITITEANISAPKFSQTIYEIIKTEYEPVGAVIITTSATDPDFTSIWGTVLQYSLLNDPQDLSIDQNGNIVLLQQLDYEVEQQKTVYVTASDGMHTATATVSITIADVNDNNPQLTIPEPVINVDREQGLIIARVTATDEDVDDVLSFSLGSYTGLFQISSEGEISISAAPSDLPDEKYSLLVTVSDNEDPPRHTSGFLTVKFPSQGEGRTIPSVVKPEDDNLITIILGAAAGALAVIIILLIVYIVWRHRRTKEELDKARAPLGLPAKGLTYRQAEAPDDLPKMDLNFHGETDDSEFGGSTTIQENPLRSTAVNEGYLQSSGSEMDRDVGEIEIETSVVPYDDDFGYPSGRVPYLNNQVRGAEDSTSTESSQSDSTGGSRRVLVNDAKQNSNKMTSWDSDDKIHPQGSQKLLDTVTVTTPKKTKKEKPEITVYF